MAKNFVWWVKDELDADAMNHAGGDACRQV
jgi:hypothetical protein